MDERTHQAMTEIDRAIAEALDVTPSPEFVARVRQRIANEPKPAASWFTWRLAVGAATAAAAVLVVALALRSNGAPPDSTPLAARSLDTQAALVGAREVRLTTFTTAPAVRRPSPTSAGRAVAEAEVLVPRAEIETYRRLIARANTLGPIPVVVGPSEPVAELQPPSELTIDPITIEPIAPSSSGEGVRQ